jgi:hypothetical protein
MPTPGSSARSPRQSARARGILILNSNRGADRTRPRHMTSKSYNIWMSDHSIGDVDGKIISRIAGATLCHKRKAPRPIVSRPPSCYGSQRDKTCRDRRAKQKPFHNDSSALDRGQAPVSSEILFEARASSSASLDQKGLISTLLFRKAFRRRDRELHGKRPGTNVAADETRFSTSGRRPQGCASASLR